MTVEVGFSRQRFKYEGLAVLLSRLGIDHRRRRRHQFNLPLIFTFIAQ